MRLTPKVERVGAWTPPVAMHPARIWPLIYDRTGVTRLEVLGDSRTARVSEARRLATHLLLSVGWNLKAVGDLMGKDHTSIIYQRNKVMRTLETNRHYQQLVKGMIEQLHDEAQQ